MALSLPPVNMGIPDQVGGQLDAGRKKLQDARKNRKARKKINDSHFQAIDSGKAQAVPGARSGVQSQQRANDTFAGSADARRQAEMTPQLREMMMETVAGEGSRGGGSYMCPALPSSGGSFSSAMDADQLADLLGSKQGSQGTLVQSMQRVGLDGQKQMQANGKLGQVMQQFGKMEQSFGQQEQAFDLKDKMYQGLSRVLHGVANALDMAGTALETAAQAVEAAASAVAAIPFVGAALSAALRAVAMMLKGIAKVLKQIGKVMQQIGQKMEMLGKQMQGMAQKMKAQKMVAQARKLAAKAQLDTGMQRLQQIQQAQGRVNDALGLNLDTQRSIVQRLNELGRRAQVGAGANPNQRVQQQQNALALGGMAGAAALLAAGALQQARPQAPVPSPAPLPSPAGLGGFSGGGFSGGGFSGGGFSGGRSPAPPRPVMPAGPPAAALPPTPAVPAPAAPLPMTAAPPAITRNPLGPPAGAPGVQGARGPHEKPAKEAAKAKAARPGQEAGKAKETSQAKNAAKAKAKATGAAKAAAKAGGTRGATAGREAGQASEVRVRYEQELSQLAAEVLALRGDDPDRAGRLPGWTGKKAVKSGAPQPVQKTRRKKEAAVPNGPLEAMALNQRQGDLARLYSQIAQEGVEIEGGVESMAMAALEGSPHRPQGRIRIARGERGVGSGGEGAAGGSEKGDLAMAPGAAPLANLGGEAPGLPGGSDLAGIDTLI